MKQTFTKLMGGALLALLLVPSSAKAQTTIASWDFTKKYTQSSVSGTNGYYTPSDEAFEVISETAFSTLTPYFYPITYVGTQTNYTISGGGNTWRTYDVYGGLDCFQIKDNPQNSLNNITDASTHNSYFEVSFSAAGYKDITVSAGLQYDNNGSVPMEWVISTDGGTTWADGGTTNSSGNWWTVTNSGELSFAVANQSDVKIRVVGEGNNTSKYWGINNFTIKGTAITSETVYNVTAVADDAAHGSATLNPVGGYVVDGTSVTATATNKTGYKFKEWQVGGSAVSTDNPYTFSVTANTNLTAVFETNTTYTLSTSVSPAYAGKVTRSLVADVYDENASITLTATPNIGYEFVEWQDGSSNQLSTENPYTFNITANTTAVAVFQPKVIAANTEVTIAGWTFDTGYDISGLVYTPNVDDWSEVAQVQAKNSQVKIFNANTAYGVLTNYEATISNDNTGKTYYSIKDNNNDKIFSLYPSGISNSVSDYTNSTEHTVYYQFSFPTLGMKDISIAPAFTYGSNAVRTLEVVYSTDGGTTWIDKGTVSGTGSWYQYGTDKVSLDADNKASVIVRLLPANGEDGDYRMNSFTVTGKIATTTVNITDAKYATYYNSIPVQLPANLEAATVDGESSGNLTYNWRYTEGDVIPGGTPVLLKATAAGDYILTYVANDATAAPTGNYLYGSDVETTTTGGGTGAKYYALQYGTGSNTDVLGFYWMSAEGAAFTSGAHKAWLALPAASTARFYAIGGGGGTTGIETIKVGTDDNVYYDLQGRRVLYPTKGFYIVNGKKVIIK